MFIISKTKSLIVIFLIVTVFLLVLFLPTKNSSRKADSSLNDKLSEKKLTNNPALANTNTQEAKSKMLMSLENLQNFSTTHFSEFTNKPIVYLSFENIELKPTQGPFGLSINLLNIIVFNKFSIEFIVDNLTLEDIEALQTPQIKQNPLFFEGFKLTLTYNNDTSKNIIFQARRAQPKFKNGKIYVYFANGANLISKGQNTYLAQRGCLVYNPKDKSLKVDFPKDSIRKAPLNLPLEIAQSPKK